jgi:hypothetical protein
MMKELILNLFVITATITASAQMVGSVNMPVDEDTGLITYKEVVEEPGSKDTLYNRGASWLATFYANPWDAAKVRDQSTGVIRIQHQFKIYDYDELGAKTEAGMILYNAKIEFKENRYRIVVDNFVLKQLSRYPVEKWLDKSAPDYNLKWENYLAQIDSFARNELIKSLKEKMKPGRQIKEDIW